MARGARPHSVRPRQFVDTDCGFVLMPLGHEAPTLCGMFKGRRVKPATLQDMKAAIAEMGSEAGRL